jgi:hypothetical protein
MGAFDEVSNILVPDDDADPEGAKAFRRKWKWDAHEQVIMRGSFTAGDHEAVQNATSPASPAQQRKITEVEARVGSGHLKTIERMIVDWTLTANGRKVTVTPQAIRRLPSNYLTPLLEKCDEIAVGMTEEEQEDFLPGVNGHTKANFDLVK